jgi:hypothetical protein
MAMTTCKECGAEISDKAVSCPKCGARIPKTRWWLVIPALAVTAFIAFGASLPDTPERQDKAKRRAVIDLCWQDYERKSFDPATKRFIAATCEKLEADFVQVHGHRP